MKGGEIEAEVGYKRSRCQMVGRRWRKRAIEAKGGEDSGCEWGGEEQKALQEWFNGTEANKGRCSWRGGTMVTAGDEISFAVAHGDGLAGGNPRKVEVDDRMAEVEDNQIG